MSVVDQQIQVNVGLIILGNPQAAINTVRIRDNARATWFNAYPEEEAVSCLPGAGAMTVQFTVQNMGETSGTIFGGITDSDGRLLLDSSLDLNPGETNTFAATFGMPTHDITLVIIAGHGTPPSVQYTLTIDKFEYGSAGYTVPSGAVTQAGGTTLQVIAYVTSGSFSGWQLDGVDVGADNPITIMFDGNHVLVALFL